MKIRPIDDMSRYSAFLSTSHCLAQVHSVCVLLRSNCNAATTPTEKLEYESLDLFMQVIKETEKRIGPDLALWKASVAFTEFALMIQTTFAVCRRI